MPVLVQVGIGRVVEHRRAPGERAVERRALGEHQVDLVLACVGGDRVGELLEIDQHLERLVALFGVDRHGPVLVDLVHEDVAAHAAQRAVILIAGPEVACHRRAIGVALVGRVVDLLAGLCHVVPGLWHRDAGLFEDVLAVEGHHRVAVGRQRCDVARRCRPLGQVPHVPVGLRYILLVVREPVRERLQVGAEVGQRTHRIEGCELRMVLSDDVEGVALGPHVGVDLRQRLAHRLGDDLELDVREHLVEERFDRPERVREPLAGRGEVDDGAAHVGMHLAGHELRCQRRAQCRRG